MSWKVMESLGRVKTLSQKLPAPAAPHRSSQSTDNALLYILRARGCESRRGVPSVNLALPPVGVHRTAEQLLHTTTLWEWLKTVVLQVHGHFSQAVHQNLRHILICKGTHKTTILKTPSAL